MLRPTLIASTLAFALGSLSALPAQAGELQVKVYNAEAGSFHVNSVLLSGEREALVIDAGFTRADAYRIAANVLDSGKTLKAIYISQADPDYYFGAATLKELFPQAALLTSPAVREKIAAKLPAKLAFWDPKMGANAPRQPQLPDAWDGPLTVDGESVEVRGTQGPLAHRPYLWIPGQRVLLGNIGVFGQLHVWTADTQQPAERQAWLAQLDEMAALQPAVVIPGHMQAGTPLDASNLRYTRDYLVRFEQEAARSGNAGELIAALKKAYPQAGLGIALDIGAKVNKGEMRW